MFPSFITSHLQKLTLDYIASQKRGSHIQAARIASGTISSGDEPKEGEDDDRDDDTMIHFASTFSDWGDWGASSSTAPAYEAFFLNSEVVVIPTDPALRVRKKYVRIGK